MEKDMKGDDLDVYGKLNKVGGEGVQDEQMITGYNLWTDRYDKDLRTSNYNSPQLVAKFLAKGLDESKRKTFKVLDVGAGTGLAARELRALGFKNIDGLDPSKEMLEKAKESNLYQNYILSYITGDPCDIPADTYDGLTGSGMFGHAHAPTESIYEMIRLVKKGGYIVLCTRVHIVTTYEEYKNLEPTMDKLEKEGKWKRICRDTSHVFYGDYAAVVYKYQVL